MVCGCYLVLNEGQPLYKAVVGSFVFFVGLLGMADNTAAQQQHDNPAPERESRDAVTRIVEGLQVDRTLRWLEQQRDEVSRGVSQVGRSFDDWLAGDIESTDINESYVRLRFNQRVGRHDAYFSNGRISGRLDLPNASERWKLIFESESVEQNTLRDQRLSNINRQSFTGGFSYETVERNGWRFNHDVGIRGRLPLEPFYRFRTRFDRPLTENWQAGFNNRIYYYHHDGWGQDSRLFFTRPINPQLTFRVESQLNYEHKDRLTEFGQSVSLYQTIAEREIMIWELGLLGQNRPESSVDSYYAQILYRRAIYKDWLVMELVPQVLFEKRYNWEPDPRVQLNLEVYFFDF